MKNTKHKNLQGCKTLKYNNAKTKRTKSKGKPFRRAREKLGTRNPRRTTGWKTNALPTANNDPTVIVCMKSSFIASSLMSVHRWVDEGIGDR